jgi:hypothetical protein
MQLEERFQFAAWSQSKAAMREFSRGGAAKLDKQVELLSCVRITLIMERSSCCSMNFFHCGKDTVTVFETVGDNTSDPRDISLADDKHEARVLLEMCGANHQRAGKIESPELQVVDLFILSAKESMCVAHSQ